MYRSRSIAVGALVALALGASCVAGEVTGPTDEVVQELPLDDIFQDAADDFGVPVELLKSIGYVETTWQMVEGVEHDGRPAAFGVMGLRGDRVAEAAALAGVDASDARGDEVANIRAAAALLRAYADEAVLPEADRADIAAWRPVVARYSDIDDPEARDHYVVDGVYGTLVRGAARVAEDGVPIATIEPTPIGPELTAALKTQGTEYKGTADYPSSVWRPSPNYNSRPSGSIGKVGMVIIHTCEGGYAGCWGWLRNSAAGASAHYVVKENGAEITQLVREAQRAWHIAATYSCSRNGSVECWRNGYSSNHFTVGIEHAGYASQKSFPTGQIEASAKLVCNITKDHGVKRDKYHIVGHGKLQPWNRTDPGANWPWTHYINRVNAHCGSGGGGGGGGDGGGGGGTGLIVDSNNANNDSAKGYIKVSPAWAASSSSAGYYGTGYYWVSTQAISDAAEFYFYLSADATKTIDAWWVAGANRSSKTPFVAFDANGAKVGNVTMNQQTNGKQWNTLGTWKFKKGWNKVVVSRWAPEGSVVVADAIRIR